jgi:hypothetical protein
MNILFALEYIPRRMRELGYGDNYVMRYHHFRIENSEAIDFDATDDLLLLINPEVSIRLESVNGIFDTGDEAVRQLQHEHTGKVKIINRLKFFTHVLLIQVTPLHPKKQPSCSTI